MGREKSPVFRRAIVPWYDTTPVCLILMGVMAMVFGFALFGIIVSYEEDIPDRTAWVPVLLSVLSAAVFISVSTRLVRRRLKRLSE
ncbi:MAG: hypothetical protein JRI76_05535 [Deltaproteobacteria bacterium]|nr:hypothetical protein [Deltaproteobacteria bacterium]MBW1954420.1 hypothetical protein [Deltaproteobacteria bacterium]MBW2041480.1 hypothetical protein [Deltaproteobacteria bacterium]MBW2131629.1 hypothetical protein [Deltaproteobacteria bacterium]